MINLLPPQRLANLRIARSNTILRRYIELSLMSIIILIAAVVMAYYFLHSQQVNTRSIVDINKKKVAQLEPVQKQATQLSSTVNIIAGLFSHNIEFSDMLTQIGGLMPQGSVLTGLQFSVEDLKSPLEISAQVDNEQKAAILRNNLATSKLFSKVDIKTVAKNNTPGSTSQGTDTTTTTPSDSETTTPSTQSSDEYPYTAVLNAYFSKDLGSTK